MWYKSGEEFKKAAGHEVDGVWYPRVTKILEVKAKPALHGYYFEMGKEVESMSDVEAVTNKSAEEGTLVHETVQKLAAGEKVEIPKEIEPAATAFNEFYKKNNIIFHSQYVERPIWSQLHKFSGTVDALATIGGKFGVLDIKTSTGFYSDYNLQTAAYVLALQEQGVRNALALQQEIQTRWILRIDQQKTCLRCGAGLREKGGRNKVRTSYQSKNDNIGVHCGTSLEDHYWGAAKGIVELREFPYYFKDIKAFLAAKTLWEWDNDYWLRQIGYL
ncbi:hypothetical protein A2W54_01585 [Candidatus Giovannonibacteria bacterium RIFCSPHIGHO2_02_43_13]|uniref:PD-(D/E)XK endonuclease-like domain-containing protein n=1 Tax=Candidatus Giovannonibacteria bacterium RIFCSPHIGHO2_02_43_13 TaxID=1798330 RepID=A0A1F5WUV4_9BACT|nr:MAG: hypothetical protein UW28_C0028G0026 [Parcubacteria group bacterium GW2011_GWA2_44_13]OGF79404.1 MAG: hypothetical protein A2W54_01585 [Candidatus Giovannonibacteria bacterium RIFCSPHIGHO2_02_43_13]OGF96720.1 MAG: hypothetical protein A3H08_01015 [Candidatus Giovannonibacteria bacterium RIFCSPLOWO2_12_FULL_44_32]